MKYPAPGLHGGQPGATARLLVARNGAVEELDGKTLARRLRKGDRVTVLTQGGGGLGDPSERDPQALARDVAEDKVSAETSLSQYGHQLA